MKIATWLLIILVVGFGSAGDVLCAKGMATGLEINNFAPSGIGRLMRSIITRKLIILGWICDALGFFSLLALLSIAQLSIAVPATALGFVVDALGARFFLHEHIHWKRWLGVFLVTAGVILTVRSSNNKSTRPRGPRTAMKSDQHQPRNHK